MLQQKGYKNLEPADYSEYKAGVDAKDFVMSLYNVPVEVGLVLKGMAVAAVLAMVGYEMLPRWMWRPSTARLWS